MSDITTKSNQRTRLIISLVASILMGLTFLVSGSGKVIGFGELPGQTMDFLDSIIPAVLLTPSVAYFIGYILIPYIIPWMELALGIFLVLSIWPRFVAILCLLLTMAFMANNSWLIAQGMENFPSCACFGIWEEMFGTLTPLQSLGYDIVLFLLALTVIFVRPGGFFSLPQWLAKLGKRGN